MAKKTVGYTQLFWTCPNCRTRNPGPKTACAGCGNPQPKDVEFEQYDKSELLSDRQTVQRARAGADIHCPYCGARNPAGTKTCSQCAGDLTEGALRKSGRVIGAYRSGTVEKVKCPSCGFESAAAAETCERCGAPFGAAKKPTTPQPKGKSDAARLGLIGLGIAAVVIAAFILSKSGSKSALEGTVSSLQWQRSIAAERLEAVTLGDWWDQIPEGADVNSCEERYRYTSSEPEENSVEVCGTPYTVDTGGGYAEVVQDCEYQVYDYYCEYEAIKWVAGNALVENGSGLNAFWPSAVESNDQRLGARQESYTIVFDTDEGIKRFVTDDYSLYQQATIGSRWELSVDGFGKIREISR